MTEKLMQKYEKKDGTYVEITHIVESDEYQVRVFYSFTAAMEKKKSSDRFFYKTIEAAIEFADSIDKQPH